MTCRVLLIHARQRQPKEAEVQTDDEVSEHEAMPKAMPEASPEDVQAGTTGTLNKSQNIYHRIQLRLPSELLSIHTFQMISPLEVDMSNPEELAKT